MCASWLRSFLHMVRAPEFALFLTCSRTFHLIMSAKVWVVWLWDRWAWTSP